MERIIDLDKWLFVKINRQGANYFFDQLMPFLRLPFIWIPFYLFLLIFIIINFQRKSLPWILLISATVAITDFVSSHIIKPFVGRLRPCNDMDMAAHIRMLAGYCGQNGSFTSSHAANHVGMAMFLFITLHPVWGNRSWLFFFWAAIICYAQIYVGVHFPLDVAGGALLGGLTGYFTGKIFTMKIGPLSRINNRL